MSVGALVGAITSVLTTIVVVITIAVALVIAQKRKAKKCGSCDLKTIVSVDTCILHSEVLCCMALVYFNSQDCLILI